MSVCPVPILRFRQNANTSTFFHVKEGFRPRAEADAERTHTLTEEYLRGRSFCWPVLWKLPLE